MKKKLIKAMSLLTVFCLLFLAACEKPLNAKTETPEEFWARPHEWKSGMVPLWGNSNEYGYYYSGEHGYLRYFDYASKKSATLCNRVGCQHIDFTCEAAALGTSPAVFFHGEEMYIITYDDDGKHIYRCDFDGSNREKKILLTKSEMEKGTAVSSGVPWLSGDALYYSAEYQAPDGEAANATEALWKVNLKTWTEEEIFRSEENAYNILEVDDSGTLIIETPKLTLLGRDKEKWKKSPVTIYYVNEKTGSMTTVYQSNYYDTPYVPFVQDSCLYILKSTEDGKTTGLEKRDLRTGQSEWLFKAPEGVRFYSAEEIGDYICIGTSAADGIYTSEFYTKDGFKPVKLPFCKPTDDILFHDSHGYIVNKLIERRQSPESDRADMIFVPIEEADKEDPEYTVLLSYGRVD